MARTIDPDALHQKITPLVEELLANTPPERIMQEIVALGVDCYHAGRTAERQYWGKRFQDLVIEAQLPVFVEPEQHTP